MKTERPRCHAVSASVHHPSSAEPLLFSKREQPSDSDSGCSMPRLAATKTKTAVAKENLDAD